MEPSKSQPLSYAQVSHPSQDLSPSLALCDLFDTSAQSICVLDLQHRIGNLEDLDLHSPAHHNLNDKELDAWVENDISGHSGQTY